jgi:hypothetical protein
MLFDVTIQRTERREHVFRVEAPNRNAAAAAAHAAAEDHDFHDSPICHADEEVTAIVVISHKNPA